MLAGLSVAPSPASIPWDGRIAIEAKDSLNVGLANFINDVASRERCDPASVMSFNAELLGLRPGVNKLNFYEMVEEVLTKFMEVPNRISDFEKLFKEKLALLPGKIASRIESSLRLSDGFQEWFKDLVNDGLVIPLQEFLGSPGNLCSRVISLCAPEQSNLKQEGFFTAVRLLSRSLRSLALKIQDSLEIDNKVNCLREGARNLIHLINEMAGVDLKYLDGLEAAIKFPNFISYDSSVNELFVSNKESFRKQIKDAFPDQKPQLTLGCPAKRVKVQNPLNPSGEKISLIQYLHQYMCRALDSLPDSTIEELMNNP